MPLSDDEQAVLRAIEDKVRDRMAADIERHAERVERGGYDQPEPGHPHPFMTWQRPAMVLLGLVVLIVLYRKVRD